MLATPDRSAAAGAGRLRFVDPAQESWPRKVAVLRLVRMLIRRLQIPVCTLLLFALDPVQICVLADLGKTPKTICDLHQRIADQATIWVSGRDFTLVGKIKASERLASEFMISIQGPRHAGVWSGEAGDSMAAVIERALRCRDRPRRLPKRHRRNRFRAARGRRGSVGVAGMLGRRPRLHAPLG